MRTQEQKSHLFWMISLAGAYILFALLAVLDTDSKPQEIGHSPIIRKAPDIHITPSCGWGRGDNCDKAKPLI